jgi:hypothetical protein
MSRFDDKRGLIGLIFLAIISLTAIVLIIFFGPRKGDVVRIDCTWVEIIPDYPVEVREKCRKLRAEKL